jgi:hypothetical protein
MEESKKREAGLPQGTWKNHLSMYQWRRGRGGEGGEAVQGKELALLSAFPGSMSNLPIPFIISFCSTRYVPVEFQCKSPSLIRQHRLGQRGGSLHDRIS